MAKFKTTVMINENVYWLQKILIRKMDIPRTRFHNRAIDYFLENETSIHPLLQIKERNDPKYVKRTIAEQIYLDEIRKRRLEEFAAQHNCGYTVVIFNALLMYCVIQGQVFIGEEFMNSLFLKEAAQDE